MKQILVLLIVLFFASYGNAQDVFYTKNGQISFYSKAPLENIEAHNNEVSSFIDVKKAEIAFSVLIKGFHFEKALMEEHFNANYLESDKYPKATFIGKVTNPEEVKSNVDGSYKVNVLGKLTIHGVTQPLSITATVTIKDKKLSGSAQFKIYLADYKVKIPSVVSQNISETVDISVNCVYLPLEN